MSKVIFEFDPIDDKSDIAMHMQAGKMLCALHEFSQFLRAQSKYGDSDVRVSWDNVKEEFDKIVTENDVDIFL